MNLVNKEDIDTAIYAVDSLANMDPSTLTAAIFLALSFAAAWIIRNKRAEPSRDVTQTQAYQGQVKLFESQIDRLTDEISRKDREIKNLKSDIRLKEIEIEDMCCKVRSLKCEIARLRNTNMQAV